MLLPNAQVVPPSSDLNVPFISVSKTNLLIEEPFTAYAIARNDGEVASTAGTLRFYRSYDSNISSSDTVMGSVALPALSVGQIFSTNKALVAPIIQRTHYIGACVVGVANETNYTDNCSTGVAVEVTALPPVATTGAATEITTIQATLNGTVDFNGIGSTVYFDWGTTQAYGNTINLGYIADGNGPVNIDTTLTDLLCNTAYHYRIRVFKSGGDIAGSDVTFTTSVCPGCGG